MQRANARRLAPRFLERRRSFEFVEERAPVHGWSGKLDELNTEESSLDRVQAEPFFVRHLAL